MDQIQEENKLENNNIPPKELTTVEEPKEVESSKDINWKKFKEARERERVQAEEVARKAAEKEAEVLALKAAMDAILNKPTETRQQYSVDEEESEDQRIEKKVNALLAQKEREAEQKRRQKEQEEYPTQLRKIYSDFDQVIDPSNLDYLEYHHPELARSLGNQPQGFDKWNDIYRAIKRYIPNTDTRKDQMKADINLKKPQSISNAGLSQNDPSRGSMRLSEERKRENWARMEKIRKGLS